MRLTRCLSASVVVALALVARWAALLVTLTGLSGCASGAASDPESYARDRWPTFPNRANEEDVSSPIWSEGKLDHCQDGGEGSYACVYYDAANRKGVLCLVPEGDGYSISLSLGPDDERVWLAVNDQPLPPEESC